MITTRNKFLSFILSFFPSTKERWKLYSKIAIPVVLSGFLVSLNGFIDNFMVTGISGGVSALNFANAFTGIIGGILISYNAIGMPLFGQFWGAKKSKETKEVLRTRYLISFAFGLIFSIMILISPEFFIKTIAKDNNIVNGEHSQTYLDIVKQATDYIKIIVISWILMSISFTTISLLRETGNGGISLYISLTSLLTNIILNLTLIPKFGVVGSAWATVCSGIVSLAVSLVFMGLKSKKTLVNPLKIFKISKKIWILFLKRIPSFLLSSSSFVFISIRTFLWAAGYKVGSLGYGEYKEYWGLGSAAILGITTSLTNIFTSTFGIIGANVTLFVGKKLGNNEIEEAKKNAKELKGFHFVIALGLSCIFAILIIFIPFMKFFSSGVETGLEEQLKQIGVSQNIIDKQKELASAYYLKEIQLTSISIAIFNPIWIIFSSSVRTMEAGGKNNLTSILQFGSGIGQILWLTLIVFVFIPNFNLSLNYQFAFYYFILFTSDLVKLFIYELFYFKTNWARNITH
ncbi:MATE family efflux transporter [Mycoplasma sp. 1012]